MISEQLILSRVPTDIANDIVVELVRYTITGKHVNPQITAFILEAFKDQIEEAEGETDE